MRHLIHVALLVVLSLPSAASARLTNAWSYQEMFDLADLVVIGAAVTTKDTGERATLPDYPAPLALLDVVTDFESRVVLKGPKDLKGFQLRHVRYENPADEDTVSNMPFLIDAKPKKVFLLFLAKQPDGKYAPVTGQTDPAFTSVLELPGSAE